MFFSRFTLPAVLLGVSCSALPAHAEEQSADMAQQVAAATEGETCEATPAYLATWEQPAHGTTSPNFAGTQQARLPIGQAVDLTLFRTPDVEFIVPPQRPAGSVSHGGLIRLSIAAAGTYRIAISTAAWIELIKGEEVLQSVNHGRGPACSGVRKMVDYALTPGDYTVEFIGNGPATVRAIAVSLTTP